MQKLSLAGNASLVDTVVPEDRAQTCTQKSKQQPKHRTINIMAGQPRPPNVPPEK